MEDQMMTDDQALTALSSLERDLNVFLQAFRGIPVLKGIIQKGKEVKAYLAQADSEVQTKEVATAAAERRRVEAEQKAKPAQERLDKIEREGADRKAALDKEIATKESQLQGVGKEAAQLRSKLTF